MTPVRRDRVAGPPHSVTSFVGRRNATTAVKRALEESRLVTLTGVGGVGKSRLALHVAEHVRRGFPDGVHFVELAKVSDPSMAGHAITAAFDLPDQSARSTDTVLADYLADKNLLIVLDNCEHLLDSVAATVSSLLASAPRVRILATSRESLNIAGERVWQVPPLSVPAGELGMRGWLSDPGKYEALALFEDRASAAVPGFKLTPENRETVLGSFTVQHEALSSLLEETGPATPSARTPSLAESAESQLTRREREVAALVAEGLSNRQIATQLVISQRTAEAHVEHILAKLGFTSRAQVASWMTKAARETR